MTDSTDPAWGTAAAPDDIPEFQVPVGSPAEEGSAALPDGTPTDPDVPDQELPEEELSGSPTADWKNADIEAWAEDNSVDLGGATTKADMLAAIDAVGNKEE